MPFEYAKECNFSKLELSIFFLPFFQWLIVSNVTPNSFPNSVSTNDLSMQSSSRMWNLVNNKSSDEKVQDRYSQINSTSYPIPHNNTDITRLNLKNKSLSVSIPIQCKKQIGDNSQNEEKRAIKASGYKN